jgi:hypothetical protein
MTYQAPEGWRLPPRGAQHAAPFGTTTPLLVHAHRALRLFVTAGAWAAGLCLVIGLVALVAATAGPASGTHVAAAAGASRLSSGTSGRTGAGSGGRHDGAHGQAAGGHRTHGMVRTFAGTGNLTTSAFSVATPSRWELRWAYQCPPGAPRGRLVIREGGAENGGVSVAAAGAAGSGSTSTYSTSASHYLVVLANCAWTVRVVGSR